MKIKKTLNIKHNQPETKSVHANCGVFGIYNHPEAAILTYYGLHALQHRGQEAAGIVTSEYLAKEKKFILIYHKGHGLVQNVFSDYNILTEVLKGNSALGHNRYSTTGASDKRANIQPFRVHYKDGNIALSHNGNLTNTKVLRSMLEDVGTIFQTSTDSELILHLIARSKEKEIDEKVLDAFSQVKGAYSICILTDDKLIAARDPYGIRPLALGMLNDSYMFASETTSFDINNAEYVREVEPGELIVIDKDVIKSKQVKSYSIGEAEKYKHCIFEYIYFSRPDSTIFGEKVDKVRRKIAKNLAIEKPPPEKDNNKDSDEKRGCNN